MIQVTNDTPIAMLTVGQLKQILSNADNKEPLPLEPTTKYVHGIIGIANLFQCSRATAHRIKRSGQIDGAIKQIGRKIIVDAELAVQLAGKRTQSKYR